MKIRQWQQQVYGKTGHGLDEHGRDLAKDVHRRRHLGIETKASSPTVSPAVAGQEAYPAQQAPGAAAEAAPTATAPPQQAPTLMPQRAPPRFDAEAAATPAPATPAETPPPAVPSKAPPPEFSPLAPQVF